MRHVEITYERTYRVSQNFEVTDDECEEIERGSLPDHIAEELEGLIDKEDYEQDYAVYDEDTGKQLVDWE